MQSDQVQNTENKEQSANQETELDPILFDSVSNNEWQGGIPDEILLDKNIDLNKLVEENPEYFNHIMGKALSRLFH